MALRKKKTARRRTTLESCMVLHRFMCSQFGYAGLRAMLGKLDDLSDQLDDSLGSPFAQGLLLHLEKSTPVKREDLAGYDANIIAHSQTLRMTDEAGKSWKPFQYLALLFTERYLDLYFRAPELLIAKLNEWKKRNYGDMPDYTADDIHTLAFQSATGSGKTLLLHANILQYRHYMQEYKQLHKLNKIILVTPDEGLSRQHLRELRTSRIPARLFSDDEAPGLLSQQGAEVDIIDLHKLREKKGVKTVALESFEENNLVLVDEGHLGVSGNKWRDYRKQLAENGFTFEYSATFNQAVSGNGDERKKLREEYGKSILFDYSYKFFYGDGYGKDYQISNLQQTDDSETNYLYLLACLLMFYQQCRIYADKGGQWRDFNIAPPLWVFLGKTVTGGASAGKKATETDVIRIIKFLARTQSRRQDAVQCIEQLTGGNTGLIDENGTDIFRDAFTYISKQSPREIYDDVCGLVFRGRGQLHVSHLTGLDELQLSAGDGEPFGVINVGNSAGLYTKLEAVENRLFALSKNAFNQPLFADVDSAHSPVTIVVGARRFAAGWNSWRVSTMGLMHVGAGEGPQIIQMFGRGVRLKGYGMSLKRHTALQGASAEDSDQLKLLETLNIFGLKANYMDKFKKYLQNEGIQVEPVVFILPTKKQFGKVKDLKIIKKQEKAGKFQYAGGGFELPVEFEEGDVIKLDRYKHLQVLKSGNGRADDGASAKEEQVFEKKHLELIDKRAVYYKVLERKRRFQWHNMTISQETVNALLENPQWYELRIPPEKMRLTHYERVREWESLAVDLIFKYADRYWRRQRNVWEHEHIEVATLNDDDLNYVAEYELSVDVKEKDLIREIEQLVERVKQGDYDSLRLNNVQLSLLAPDFHAYIPLLHANEQKIVQITPAPLNDGEAEFVCCLKDVVEHMNLDFMDGREVYLMRNSSRGRGISFFDDYSFYPDFILWVKGSGRQDILFVDPKGLVRFDAKIQSKVDLHHRIKDTEKKIKKDHPEIFLHSYIWSNTEPQNIGTDKKMTTAECHQKGIYIASRNGGMELMKLLQHAL